MFKINPINNVNSTLNRQVSFGAGVQTNYGVKVPNQPNIVENNLFTVFGGILDKLVNSRAKSIEARLNETKLNYIA